MNAVHWIRSRQEERELAYWLSFVSYEHNDRSLNNRIYLLYLIIFLSVWLFAMLTFFASGGAVLLQLLNPIDPVRAALFLEVLLLGGWSVFAFWRSQKRSPVVFSEQDEVLICQMPVNRRHVTIRWFLMPWLKSAVPFWLIAITLGFSVAEITLPGVMSTSRILEYAGYGLRAWLAIIPFHLALLSLQWVAGIYRLQKNLERHWLSLLVIPTTIVFFSFLLIFTFRTNTSFLVPFISIVNTITSSLQVGFEMVETSYAVLSAWILALTILGIMYWISGTFSLSRAAQETHGVEVLNSAQRYGFTVYEEKLQTQQRLGVKRTPSSLLAVEGAGILIWKDILQSQRTFRVSSLFVWLRIFILLLGFSLLPDLGSRTVLIAIWAIQIGQVTVIRVRNDLSHWSLIRQLPVSYKKFLLFELSSAYVVSVLISFAGLALNSVIFNKPIDGFSILIPGIIAGVAGMAVFDVIRRSRISFLLNGDVADLSAGGILLGVLFAIVPVVIYSLMPGIIGFAFSTLLSLGLGVSAFILSAHSYQNIDDY